MGYNIQISISPFAAFGTGGGVLSLADVGVATFGTGGGEGSLLTVGTADCDSVMGGVDAVEWAADLGRALLRGDGSADLGRAFVEGVLAADFFSFFGGTMEVRNGWNLIMSLSCIW